MRKTENLSRAGRGARQLAGGETGASWREMRKAAAVATVGVQPAESSASPRELKLPTIEDQKLFRVVIEKITTSGRPFIPRDPVFNWSEAFSIVASIPDLTQDEQRLIDGFRQRAMPRVIEIRRINVPEVSLVEGEGGLLLIVADAEWLPLLTPEKVLYGRNEHVDMHGVWRELFSGGDVNLSSYHDHTRGQIKGIVDDNVLFINSVFNDVGLRTEWRDGTMHLTAKKGITLHVREFSSPKV